MSNKTQKKFKIDPVHEVVETMVRLAKIGIDPGETIPPIVRRLLYSDLQFEGEVETRLHRHPEE